MRKYELVDFDGLEDVESTEAATDTPRFEFSALCTSEDCAGEGNGVVVLVEGKHVDECPVCGYYLFWSRGLVS